MQEKVRFEEYAGLAKTPQRISKLVSLDKVWRTVHHQSSFIISTAFGNRG